MNQLAPAHSVGVCLNYITSSALYAYLFTASTLLYAVCYDDLQHPYLSRVYQTDKYGIVITYALVTFMSLALIWSELIWNCLRYPAHGQPRLEQLEGTSRWHIFTALCNVVFVNFIFKNNTDDTPLHSGIHFTFVVLLGGSVIATTVLLTQLLPVPSWGQKTLRLAVFGVVHVLLAESSYTNWRVVNFFSVLSQSLLLQETILVVKRR